MDGIAALFEQLCRRDRRAMSRALTVLERGGDEATALNKLCWPTTTSAHLIGITGAPGAGKSTLTASLVGVMSEAAHPVAVLAVDPSSPLSGGAILGDRIRMQKHALNPDVYIRSIASRGHLGGLATVVPQAVRLLEAAGTPWIAIETVGVGQSEVEIAGSADTTIVVVNPGWGDSVQANKAGLLEVADIFVVNKADRDGANQTRGDLQQMLSLTPVRDGWRPPILSTVAHKDEGVDDLWDAVCQHRDHLRQTGAIDTRRRDRSRAELRSVLADAVVSTAFRSFGDGALEALVADLLAGRTDLDAAVSDFAHAFAKRITTRTNG